MIKSRLFVRRRAASIVRLLPLLDEADILERNLRWYDDQGIVTVAFDNGSTDGTGDIARRAHETGRLASLRQSEQQVDWPQVSAALLEQATEQNPDLVLIAGADEFLEVVDGTPLRKAIETDLAKGQDILIVETMEFCLTDEDQQDEADPVARMRRYSPYRVALGERGVRWSCGVQWAHPNKLKVPDDARRSPRRYVSRHYPLRTTGQALNRAQTGRLRRAMLAGNSAAGLSPLVDTGADLSLPSRKLPRYDNDHRWEGAPVVADLRLVQASKLIHRESTARTKLHRQLARREQQRSALRERLTKAQHELTALRRRYADVLLERDRLAAGGAQPIPGRLGASAEWYDEQYRLTLSKYDSDYSDSVYFPVWEAITGRIDRRASVLEIGCGTGQLARMLIDQGLQRYQGFDFSEFAIELARKRLPESALFVADARATALMEETTYDIALCTEVLEHLDDDLALLRRIRAQARVLATVPNFDSASHLRFFADEDQVVKHYGAVIRDLEVTRIPLPRDSAIFLLDGVAAGRAET